MSRAEYLSLFVLGLLVAIGVAWFQSSPGYMDADYYMAGGVRLAEGHGFTEITLWNYLDDPAGLPHPSHSYWMPLASMVASVGMFLTGSTTFSSARLGFILLAAFVPPLTALLARRLTGRAELALLAGFLAAFQPYQTPFISTIDNFVIYNILGAGFFLALLSKHRFSALAMGAAAGLLNLARTDGLLWLPMAALAVILRELVVDGTEDEIRYDALFSRLMAHLPRIGVSLLWVFLGYLFIMGPWFARNTSVFGTLMAPGGSHAAWLTRYDQTFTYPASRLTLDTFLASGWPSILDVRWWALTQNLGTAFAAQGGILLAPLIFLALWKYRNRLFAQLSVLAWLGLYLVMSLVFPFAGVRGSFFHAGAALMPLGCVLAPVGLDIAVAAARRRNLFTPQAFRVFRVMFLGLVITLTLVLFNMRVIHGDWELSDQRYRAAEQALLGLGAGPNDVLMVANPPGYYLASGRPAVVLPTSPQAEILEVVQKFQVRYVLLEADSLPAEYIALYNDKEQIPFFNFLQEGPGFKIYGIHSGE